MTAEPDADFDSIAAAIAGRTGSSFNPRSASPVGGGAQLGVALAQLHRVTGALFG